MKNPSIEDQRTYYDERWGAETYANLLQLDRAVVILRSLRALGIRNPKIVDLGCGTGWLTSILSRFGPTTGIELSPVAVNRAQALYPNLRFMAADFSTLEPEETFDIVVSQEVIEHVEDQRHHVDLITRLLRPGGYLILTTPNAWNLAHWAPEAVRAWEPQPIEQWLTKRELRNLFTPRFRILHLETFILGHGTRGVCRLVNSPRLTALISALHVTPAYKWALQKMGFGLYMLAVAQLRPRA